MNKSILNRFKIGNWKTLDFTYKLVEFDLQPIEGEEASFTKQLLAIAQKVASIVHGPSVPIKRSGRYYIAVSGYITELSTNRIDISPWPVKIALLPDIYRVDNTQYDPDNYSLIQAFLDFSIRNQLNQHSDLWKLNSNTFFSMIPISEEIDPAIDVYQGFAFRLDLMSTGEMFIVLDVTYKYLSKQYVSDIINEIGIVAAEKRLLKHNGLYMNGDDWYQIEMVKFGNGIGEQEFRKDNRSFNVLKYIRDKTKGHRFDTTTRLSATDPSLLYKYPGRTMSPHSGATSLTKLVYRTNELTNRDLHRRSILPPYVRFDAIIDYVRRYFSKLTYNGKALEIASHVYEERLNSFQLPTLQFNNGKQLIIGQGEGQVAMRNFGIERKQCILQQGILNQADFPQQYLLVPATMKSGFLNALLTSFEQETLKKLAPSFPGFTVIHYPVLPNVANVQQFEAIRKVLDANKVEEGYALLILPGVLRENQYALATLHDCAKRQFFPRLHIQCASVQKMVGYFQPYPDNKQPSLTCFRPVPEKLARLKSYLFNLALEYLNLNLRFPYALANPVHYDVYIGMDVQGRYVGFTFFYKNGDVIRFKQEAITFPAKSNRVEKVKASQIERILFETLKEQLRLYCPNPNGIVLLRDGRSFNEGKVLQKVIQKLDTEANVLDQHTTVWAVIELQKQNATPLRMVTRTDGYERVENPKAGAYWLRNEQEGYLFTTGYPFRIEGTSRPLHAMKVAGNAQFISILEDVFAQTMLAFSAPDLSNSLPITIKLIDTFLQLFTDREPDEHPIEEEEPAYAD
ncbi:hypothetical protein BH09BAC4_BH09BAC4_21110 [soil metagenome]